MATTAKKASAATPRFLGTGAPFKNVLNGIAGKVDEYRVSKAIAAALAKVSTSNWVAFGAGYHIPKDALSAQLADPAKASLFFYSVLFRADGSIPPKDGQLAWGGVGDPGPDMSAGRVSRAEAFRRALKLVSDEFGASPGPADAARKKEITAALRLALGSLFADAGFVPYYAHWDNSDDTTVEGVIGVHSARGDVRVITLWSPA